MLKICKPNNYGFLLFAGSFTLLGIVLSPYLIKAMGATGELARLGNIYLRITFLDMIFLFLFFNINSIMNAQGNTVTPTILSGVSALLNVVLDPIFIFIFNWGIAGAAWATLVSRAALAIVGLKMLFGPNNKIKPNLKGFKFNKDILKEIINVGFPSSIGQAGAFIGLHPCYATSCWNWCSFNGYSRTKYGADQIDRVVEAFHKAVKIH